MNGLRPLERKWSSEQFTSGGGKGGGGGGEGGGEGGSKGGNGEGGGKVGGREGGNKGGVDFFSSAAQTAAWGRLVGRHRVQKRS